MDDISTGIVLPAKKKKKDLILCCACSFPFKGLKSDCCDLPSLQNGMDGSLCVDRTETSQKRFQYLSVLLLQARIRLSFPAENGHLPGACGFLL